MTEYNSNADLLDKARKNVPMSDDEKLSLKVDIGRLNEIDHIEILKIIRETMATQVYTVSNRQTMFDLDDLSNECLWCICYWVKRTTEHMLREEEKKRANQIHLEQMKKIEENLKQSHKNATQ